MANLSKKLERLFRDYLVRKEKERLAPPSYSYGGGYGSYCRQNDWLHDDNNFDGVIYFYELSDTNRAPQLFYNIGAFDSFLRRYNIFMPPFQKDIIKQLERSHIACKKGCHELVIRGTKAMLEEALGRADSPGVDVHTAGQAILNTPAPCGHGYPAGGIQFFREERQPPMYSGYPDQWY